MKPGLLVAGALLAGMLVPASAMAAPNAPSAEAAHPAQLFVFTYRPGPAWRVGLPMNKQALGPHGAYHKALVAEGRSFAAGRFLTSEGGMAIIQAADLDEAKAMLAADPAIRSGVFVGQVEAWKPRFISGRPLPAD